MNITTYSSNVAADYAAHRRAHPGVLDELTAGLQRTSGVLEVGCGTGNYISAIHDRIECLCVGIDPSPHMLAVLNARAPLVRAFVGSGEHLAVPDNTFDLLFSVDVVHHLVDRRAAFRQAFRAIKPGGRVCVVTDSEWIIRNRSPLSVYFPETISVELSRYAAVPTLLSELSEAGFESIDERMVENFYELEDAAAYRAKAFSALKLLSDEAFAKGIGRLEADLRRGPIQCVSRYVLLSALKP